MRHLICAAAFAAAALPAFAAPAANSEVARGKYLVNAMGCQDCHTAGSLYGPPTGKFLAGSDTGFAIPGLGVFYGPNLTPDKETGIGTWTKAQIATAITTGKTPDGRVLAPVMPVADFKNLTHADALAIGAYLKTIPAVHNKVPGPFGPAEMPVKMVMPVLPAEVYAKLPQPKPPK